MECTYRIVEVGDIYIYIHNDTTSRCQHQAKQPTVRCELLEGTSAFPADFQVL